MSEMKALMAITALRQLKGHKVITDTEYESIKAKIQSLYGKWLSPIRTEQDGVLSSIISESDKPYMCSECGKFYSCEKCGCENKCYKRTAVCANCEENPSMEDNEWCQPCILAEHMP